MGFALFAPSGYCPCMAILIRCPMCHLMQSVNKKRCKSCGEDIDKLKRSRKIKYWISTSIPTGERDNNGKRKYRQHREYVGTSIDDARAADGKRKGQKREGRIFEILPQCKMTFAELKNWYLNLKSVKRLAYYERVEIALRHFCDMHGELTPVELRLDHIEDFQDTRLEKGRAPSTVHQEVAIVQTMVNRAFDHELVEGNALRCFRRRTQVFKPRSNARKRVFSPEEYNAIYAQAASHLRDCLTIAINTGMRTREILTLEWDHIDLNTKFIRLPAENTKEKRPKDIPINGNVEAILRTQVRLLRHNNVISYQGKPIGLDNGVQHAFRSACTRAEVPHGRKTSNGVTFHDIRRTVKTGMAKAGVPKEYRDALLGHVPADMDAHYLVVNDDDLRFAMSKYTAWLDDQLQIRIKVVSQSKNQDSA